MEILWTIIGLCIMCIACWIMGYRTCASRSKNEYDRGWLDAEKNLKEEYVMYNRDEIINQIWREEQGKQILNEMENLFEDKDIIDGGCY